MMKLLLRRENMTVAGEGLHTNISSQPGRKWLILTTVLLGATMSALDVSIVTVAMPTLKTTFAVSMSVIEWVVMAYMLTLTVFLPLFGRLADSYGTSRLYTIGFVVFSAGSFLCGISPAAGFLIASRIVQAVGAGLLQANSVALIIQAFPAGQRGKAIGIQGAVQAISMAVGPFVGGILIATAGWRSVFYVNIPIGIIGTTAALFILPRDQRAKTEEKIDYLGAAFFALGLGILVLAFNEGVKLGWGSPTIIGYFAGGVVLLALFVLNELKAAHPLIDLRLFRSATFFVGNLTSMLSYYVLFAIMFLMPFYLEKVLGYGVALTGFLLTPLLLAMAVVAPLSGYISDKYGSKVMTTSGLVVSALACLTFLYIGEMVSFPLLLSIIVLLGVGMGFFTPSNNSAIMAAAPTDRLGMAGGILNMTRSLGLILGVDVSGGIFTTLQHRYLAEKGYVNVQHTFSNSGIPLAVRADAFMHGFIMVIGILLAITLVAALLSAFRREQRVPIINHELAGTGLISSGFLGGFSQEARSVALFVMLLLFTGVAGTFAVNQTRNEDALLQRPVQTETADAMQRSSQPNEAVAEARNVALAYYTEKYHDSNVSIDIRPAGNHMEAEIRKEGALVKKLSIKGKTVKEQPTGLHEWVFDLLTNLG
jgi:EmrB/QacA subfamily drug resistance transporter